MQTKSFAIKAMIILGVFTTLGIGHPTVARAQEIITIKGDVTPPYKKGDKIPVGKTLTLKDNSLIVISYSLVSNQHGYPCKLYIAVGGKKTYQVRAETVTCNPTPFGGLPSPTVPFLTRNIFYVHPYVRPSVRPSVHPKAGAPAAPPVVQESFREFDKFMSALDEYMVGCEKGGERIRFFKGKVGATVKGVVNRNTDQSNYVLKAFRGQRMSIYISSKLSAFSLCHNGREIGRSDANGRWSNVLPDGGDYII